MPAVKQAIQAKNAIIGFGFELHIIARQIRASRQNGKVFNRLSEGKQWASAYSVYVSGDDVYVAGHVYNSKGKPAATLWKNGKVFKTLSDGDYTVYAHSVFVK